MACWTAATPVKPDFFGAAEDSFSLPGFGCVEGCEVGGISVMFLPEALEFSSLVPFVSQSGGNHDVYENGIEVVLTGCNR